MASTWDKIPQTHRAILFEQFTHSADTTCSLYDLLNDDTSSDEELYKAIKDKLEVHSFKDFIDKFQPKVFQYMTGTANGVPIFQYTTNPIEAKKIEAAQEIEITNHTYYEMLVNMYSQKGDSGVANIEFDDKKLREILTPKREIESLYDTRRQIPLLMEKYNETIEKNENADHIAEMLIEIRCEAVEQTKNPIVLMAVRLDDINRKIATVNEKILQLNAASSNGEEAPKLLSGRGGFDNDGHWILIPAKASTLDSDESSDSPSDPQGDAVGEFTKILKEDLDENAPEESDFAKALIVSAYTGREIANSMENKSSAELVEYREQLIDAKNIIEASFKQAKEAFIKVLSENVQKLLCVKIFFDHATTKGGKLPKAGLIVTNCSAAKLIDDKVKRKFESTMRHLGLSVSDESKLWFAILPHVLRGNSSSNARKNINLKMNLRDYQKAKEGKKVSINGTNFSAAKSILKIMEDCKIMTVFNFAPDKKTTFSALNAATVNALQDELEPLNYEHAVYALPNFTIMREGKVPLSENTKIEVPAIYIDAAYVAAGLLIAAQQTAYWENRGFTKSNNLLIPEYACVRVDFESSKIVPKLLTKFNRERSIAWESEIVDALSKKRFGFTFDGDRKYDSQIGGFIDKTYILNARTLKQKDGKYQEIFRTLLKDFVRAYLKTYGAKIDSSDLKDFVKKVVNMDWKQLAKSCKNKNPDVINLILRDGEDILLDGNNLKVQLSGGEDFLDVEVID